MQVSVESLGNLERRMTLRVPTDSVESQIGGRLRELARTARIKGFRPGKVPAKVVEQRYGQQVRAEVVDAPEIVEMEIGFDGLSIAQAKDAPAVSLTKQQVFLALAKIVPDKDGKHLDLSGEVLTKHSAKPLIISLNAKELSDDDFRRHIRHPEYLIRHMIANMTTGRCAA